MGRIVIRNKLTMTKAYYNKWIM